MSAPFLSEAPVTEELWRQRSQPRRDSLTFWRQEAPQVDIAEQVNLQVQREGYEVKQGMMPSAEKDCCEGDWLAKGRKKF